VRTDRLRLLKERSAALKQAADNEINVLAAKKDRYDTAVMNTSSTVSNNDSYLTRSMTNPDLLTKKTARNLAGIASVGVLDTSHDDASVSQVGLQLGNTSFYNDDNISAFSPETSSVKFNSSLQGETPKYFGKRLFAQDQTDWNRIGHGGSTQQNAGIEAKEHYRSVYRDRYDDMIYEPSKVLTHSLTHSLTLTHLLTYLLTYSLTHLLTHLLAYSLTYSLTLTHSITVTSASYVCKSK